MKATRVGTSNFQGTRLMHGNVPTEIQNPRYRQNVSVGAKVTMVKALVLRKLLLYRVSTVLAKVTTVYFVDTGDNFKIV